MNLKQELVLEILLKAFILKNKNSKIIIKSSV